MIATLVHRFAVGLLALAVIGAPVLGGVSTCCGKSSASPEQATCCCGYRQDSPESCCSQGRKSCCAKKRQAAAAVRAPASSNCCCKARGSQPAVPEETTGSELRCKPIFSLGLALEHVVLGPESPAILPLYGKLRLLPGTSLQSLLCRWIV